MIKWIYKNEKKIRIKNIQKFCKQKFTEHINFTQKNHQFHKKSLKSECHTVLKPGQLDTKLQFLFFNTISAFCITAIYQLYILLHSYSPYVFNIHIRKKSRSVQHKNQAQKKPI